MNSRTNRWCIVVGDDHGPEWAPSRSSGTYRAPVQYCRLGEPRNLFQNALRRALRVAPPSQIVVTARDAHRDHWESSVWFAPIVNRVVGDSRVGSQLTTAAALLSIAAKDASSIVTVLPARCYVQDERILAAALDQAGSLLPLVSERVITLGMIDRERGIDEDYLVANRATVGPGFSIIGFARRPVPWVALYLRMHGAMAASGIMIGYAAQFAAHISKQWPALARKLTVVIRSATAAGAEREIPVNAQPGAPGRVMNSLRWRSLSFTQRAFRVHGCGWSSLNSPNAIARISDYVWDASDQQRHYEVLPPSKARP